MGELFSALTKQMLGVFLLSAGLPAIALVLGVRALIIPAIPLTWSSVLDPELFEAEWQVALLVVAILVVAAILAGLNGPITRLYEGYPLRHSWLGQRMCSRHEALVAEAEEWWKGTRTILRKINRLRADDGSVARLLDGGTIEDLSRTWNLVGQSLPQSYPKAHRVLPTRLGNAIRAFEDYPRDKYGMYAVTLCPRLLSVVEESDRERLGASKQPMDLMLNSALVSGVLAFLVLAVGLIWPQEHMRATTWPLWMCLDMGLLATSYAFYRLAIPRAVAWGETVKAMFDICRWDLLVRVRVAESAGNMEEEKRIWSAIGGHMLFGRMATDPPLAYSDGRPPSSDRPLRPTIGEEQEKGDAQTQQ